jgi:hypothetical protein
MHRTHESFHGQGDLFCRGKTPFPTHRPAHIEEQYRGGAGRVLGLVHGKVSRLNPYRNTTAVQQGIFQSVNHIDIERVSLHIGAAIFGHQLLTATMASIMPAHAIATQLLINISQR